MKHLFIINPVAGKSKTLKLIPHIEDCFKENPGDYTIEITKYPGHATEIACDYSSRGTYRIYSVGGDGTLNEVLNGMAGTSSSLAVIPSGSGNDFIKSITGRLEPEEMLQRTINGEVRNIDIAKVNDRYFVNIASLGFDALVAFRTGKFKKLPLINGKMAYILGILSSILECKNVTMKINIDGFEKQAKSLLAAIGIGRFYGGGMMALPEAVVDDGLLDICHVEDKNRLDILRLFPKYIKGRHGTIKGVNFYRGAKVEIIPESPVALNVDGEITMVGRALFEIIPGGLKFVYPAGVMKS